MQRLKNIRIRKFECDIFSIPLTVTSSETRKEKWILLNRNSNCMIINRPGEQITCANYIIFRIMEVRIIGAYNFFDVDELLNYRSSNYMSSIVYVES